MSLACEICLESAAVRVDTEVSKYELCERCYTEQHTLGNPFCTVPFNSIALNR